MHSPPVAGQHPPLSAGLPSPSPRPQPPLLLPPLLLGWHDGGNLLLLLRHVLVVVVILKGNVLPVRWDTQRALLPTGGGGGLALAPPQPLPGHEPLLIWCQPARCTGPEPAARRKVTGGCSLKLSRLSCEETEPS